MTDPEMVDFNLRMSTTFRNRLLVATSNLADPQGNMLPANPTNAERVAHARKIVAHSIRGLLRATELSKPDPDIDVGVE